jgi:hypothetical protein
MRKHLHDLIVLQWDKAWANKTNLTPPFVDNKPVRLGILRFLEMVNVKNTFLQLFYGKYYVCRV